MRISEQLDCVRSTLTATITWGTYTMKETLTESLTWKGLKSAT